MANASSAAAKTADVQPVIERVDQEFEQSVRRLSDFLKIPSISTDPQYTTQVKQAAEWICDQLTEIGFQATVRETEGHPMVVGYDPGPGEDADVPTLLYYGHYDVQPPDPLELWDSPPFEPAIVDSEHGGKRIVARGAVDDKGQLMLFVEAFRYWKAVHGKLPVKVKILLEGEEESGSKSLDPFLQQHKDELAADVCVVSDTGMWDIDTPAVTTMLRGLLYTEVTLQGPDKDLHSGMYGGAVLNPINALARVLGALIDDSGRIQVPGFYDDVEEPSTEELESWKRLGFDEQRFLASAGLKASVGEEGRSVLERVWSRPTCDINGIIGGYTGAGAKTVIPAQASAKVSFRLVPSQDPHKVMAGFRQFLEQRTPVGGKWQMTSHGGSPAIRVATDSPYLEAARTALGTVYDRDAVLIGCGGSIPVVGSIQKILGFDSLLVGFGLEDDQVHSPNEKFELRCYEMGIKSHAAMLAEFAGVKSA